MQLQQVYNYSSPREYWSIFRKLHVIRNLVRCAGVTLYRYYWQTKYHWLLLSISITILVFDCPVGSLVSNLDFYAVSTPTHQDKHFWDERIHFFVSVCNSSIICIYFIFLSEVRLLSHRLHLVADQTDMWDILS